jgi:MFS family permease
MMTSLCQSYYQFMLAQGVLGGASMGMAMAPAMAAMAQYFKKKRGAAMGIGVAGSSLGGVIFPIALNKMFANASLGFGWTVRIVAFLMLGILLLSCLPIRARLPPRKGGFFLPSAFKELPFITLLVSLFLMMLGVFTPIFYLSTYAVYYGMDTQLANYLIAILNGMSLFGRVIPGILADKFGTLNLLLCFGLCTGILVICWQRITTNASIIAFSAFYGFSSGAIVSLMTASLAHVPKDPRNIGTYMGMGMATVSFAALSGPPINGALVTHYGSFDQAAIFSGVVVIVGSFAILLAKHASTKGVFGKV